jgi:hypothetical protein
MESIILVAPGLWIHLGKIIEAQDIPRLERSRQADYNGFEIHKVSWVKVDGQSESQLVERAVFNLHQMIGKFECPKARFIPSMSSSNRHIYYCNMSKCRLKIEYFKIGEIWSS